MIHPALPSVLVAVLAGLGVYGILARRHAVLVLVGVELILGAAGLLLVTVGSTTVGEGTAAATSGPVLTLFLITIAAAEVVVALAVFLALSRERGHVDLAAPLEDGSSTP
ncbi:NADH:ubiquinone oxidoreductase subunit K [Ornithinimicrobium sp. CNJ-824]|uniref:NADH-quinone oxidoreductase subunit K n=1 Tax=Ornithinimicrobium sp. CNJ-824 TaxID=1904966 RepID=UPI0009624572|nr:NADH-quinone oxidoreductase subunit K [Ornithinimicrobium sp. CNJ-824]OLT23559.1 NADH:ubiquinone oxidoreductase subunit K [Ornithinimicrobium sp. CNJ-824]